MGDWLHQTFQSLRAHALRFTLTSLGITWGAFMLTYLSASMLGLDRHYRDAIEKTGPRIVYLFPGAVLKNRVGERGARRIELDADDVGRIREIGVVEAASPNLTLWSQIVRGDGRTKLLTVFGVMAESRSIRNFEVAQGRYLTERDVAAGAQVAFLGHEAAQRLFGRAPALGRTIQIEDVPFRVAGVAAEKGDQLVGLGGRDDRAVLVPYTTAQRWLRKNDVVDSVVFAPLHRRQGDHAITRIRELVGLHHGFDPSLDTALSFVNIHEVLQIIDALFFGMSLFMLAAGLVTLAVGAVGVMNIMLVVVGERTREIGLRKAVGAPSRAIFLAFLSEATAVCVISGGMGTAMGCAASWYVAAYPPPGRDYGSPPVVDPTIVAALVVTLVVVGIVAGALPAWRASRIAPAEALRAQ